MRISITLYKCILGMCYVMYRHQCQWKIMPPSFFVLHILLFKNISLTKWGYSIVEILDIVNMLLTYGEKQFLHWHHPCPCVGSLWGSWTHFQVLYDRRPQCACKERSLFLREQRSKTIKICLAVRESQQHRVQLLTREKRVGQQLSSYSDFRACIMFQWPFSNQRLLT